MAVSQRSIPPRPKATHPQPRPPMGNQKEAEVTSLAALAMDAGIITTFRLKKSSLGSMKQSVPTADVPIRRTRFLAPKIRNLSKSRCMRTAARFGEKSTKIDKGKLGISVWVTLLLEKYLYQRPINRLLESFKDIEFDASPGIIGDGLKKLPPLFEPVLKEIIKKNQTERHLHADETRWMVFEFIDGRKSYRWYMWVFVSKNTVVYILDPSRATSVIEKHLNVVSVLILSVDRYSSYKSFAKDREYVVLAFCWTHVRRDFLDTANGFSELEAWAMGWVDSIGEIFHLNNQRVQHEVDSIEFAKVDQSLREALDAMKQQFESELTEAYLHPERAKRLNSIREHWEGLMVFVDHPWIPMDNSEAERRMRMAALGRKNYYGSGSVASGHFTACLFSIFQTLKLWNVNPRKWLTRYLQACADNRDQVPDDLTCFLPWMMSAEQLAKLQYAPGYEDT